MLVAGGLGRRAGVDKRYLVLGGQTLLRRNLDFLRALFPTVAVGLRHGQDLDLGDLDGIEVVRDAWPGGSPLAGIATALRTYGRPVFVLAVDIAFPQRWVAEAVLAAFPGHDVSLPAIAREYRQPLFAVYGERCLAPMSALLDDGRHRIATIFPEVRVATVPFPDDSLFRNINTMDDFREAQREAAAPAPAGAAAPALAGVVGGSGSAATTFLEELVPELCKLGLRVGLVRREVGPFEVDHPGKDSWRHGRAGAEAYVVASPDKLAFVANLSSELPLTTIARRFFGGFDLVLAEGYGRSTPHVIELSGAGAGREAALTAPGGARVVKAGTPLAHGHRSARDAAGIARLLASRLDSLRQY